MTACPDSGDLDRFINDELDADARTRIAAHLASCASCSETLDGLADDTETIRWRQLLASPDGPSELAFLARLAEAPPGVAANTAPAAETPWPTLPGYQILELLGTGGMGAVYLAHHETLGRKVAVKVLRADLARDADAVKRFQTSVQLLARLDPHRHLAWAMHAGEHEGTHFLVMDYVEGVNLKTMVQQQGPLAVEQACTYIRQAALGLEHAHQSRIIHRDVKPANLVLTPEGNIKVIDLGLARQLSAKVPPEAASSLTEVGAVLGTLDYLAPEQARDSHSADARSDLYGLGCTFYFLLTGKPPFAERNPLENVVAHALEDPVPIRTLRPDVPAAVGEVVHKLLAKKPEDRYPSARDLIDALDNRDRPTPDAGPVPKRSRKWVGVALGVAVLLLLPLAYVFGPQVIRIATNKGELIIETDDPNIEVLIKQGGATIIDPTTKRRIDLKVGDYDIELSEAKEGLQLSTKKFTLTRGGRAVVKVWFEPPTAKQPKTPKTPVGSPLDALDPKAIPESERFDWQPKELVALIGEHRQRNWATVDSLSLHPKGDRVASYGIGAEIGFWEIPSGKILWPQNKLDGRFFHPDGKHLFGWRKEVYDISRAKPVVVGELPDAGEFFCSSRDGKRVLTWYEGWDYLLVLDCSDLSKVTEVGRIPGAHRGALSPDGKLIAASAGNAAVAPIRILELDAKQTKLRFKVPATQGPGSYRGGSPAFSFAPDGRLGICNQDGVFQLWDVSGKEPKLVASTPKIGAAHWAVFSPDGSRIAVAGGSATIQVWQINARLIEKTSEIRNADLRLKPSHPQALAFLPDGNRIATGHLNGAVRYWDITEKQAKEINPIVPGVFNRFEVSADGKRLLVMEEDGRPTSYRFGAAAPERQLFPGLPTAQAGDRIGSDTSIAWLGGRLFTLGDQLAEVSLPKSMRLLAFSNQGELGLFASDANKRIAFWTLRGKAEPLTDWIEAATEDKSHVISPSGRHVLQHDPRGKISLWLHAGKKLTKTSEVNCSSIAGMTFSPDGQTVAVFPIGNPIQLYQIRDDKLVPIPPATLGRLHGNGCFSPDGKQLARCGQGIVQVFDYPRAKLRHEWKFPGIVQRVLFAPDNRHLFVLGYNGVLYILRLPPPPTPAAVEAAWLKLVADLPAEKQIDAVREKLIDLNPGFDGKGFMGHAEGGSVFSVSLGSDNIKDISPLRVWPQLQFLSCDGSSAGKGQLADLSPLKGMKLKGLHCQDTQVADLSPLQGMPFGYLNLKGTKVKDLAPLKGMKLASLGLGKTLVTDLKPLRDVELTSLDVSRTPVADLTALEGVKLNILSVSHTKVTDLRALKGMPLYSLHCNGTNVESLAPLKDMPLTRLQIADTKISDLAPLEGMKLTHFECDRTPVKDLSPLRGMKLVHLQCSVTKVDDLAPLAEIKLKSLDCSGTGVSSLLPLKGMALETLTCGGTKVSDLRPLEGMPLSHLDCSSTLVTDLTPLKGMKLASVHFGNTKVFSIAVLKGMPIKYMGFPSTNVTDLSPLKGMPLKQLFCSFKAERDADILRSIKTLEKINDKPADEFWKSIGKLPGK